VSFDLRAATEAARTEATSKPFEFDWGDEHFEIPPMSTWPIEVSESFAELAGEDVDPSKVFTAFRRVIGAESWERFARTVPLDALTALIEEMSVDQAGVSAPNLSPPLATASTPT
jgi:hypothetical protein